jgi:hypothetical protein
LYQELHVKGSFILANLTHTKISSNLKPHTTVVQEQFYELQKTLNLTGGGRGKRDSPEQHHQFHIQTLAQTKRT